MMKLQQLLQSKREDILAVALRHGAFNVRVFGSVARGVVDESSDIDFLVDYDYRKLTLVPSDALDRFARYVRL